ncbi:glutamine amidotransferase-related protein [Dyadobacter frigoris]|uniref:Amidotransferase n=1 Tax=Dyadobacter frigoris TaxID=2576211 RepID=A0A4U6D567_9BACT|nr:amidotransferase [Dyadobacter frigoris]TKT91846.1 amidotransferase [Dyadobacter frigoris]GLU53291.1 GMP synthase [Dyadobacter frigoris]
MKIGLLECDHVRVELLPIAGDYRKMFPALFSKVAPHWQFEFFDVCNGHFPTSVDACDVYICTGSKSSVYDDDEWIKELKTFVREISQSGKIYIGVCFGHQILGEALGGEVKKSDVDWCVGVHSFEILKLQNWMRPALSSFNLLMMCQDQVLKLPADSVLLAQTPDCPHGMFQVGETMLGIQAHPEFPKAYDKALMELRVERIGERKVEMGVMSLELPTEEIQMAQWIVNFADRRIS